MRRFASPISVWGVQAILLVSLGVAIDELHLGFVPAIAALAALLLFVSASAISPATRAGAYISLAVAVALLAPNFKGGQSGTPIRYEDGLVIVGFAAVLLSNPRALRKDPVTMGLAGLAAAAVAALLGSSLTSSVPATWADFWFLARMVKYAMFWLVGFELGRRIRGREELPICVVLTALGLFALIGIAQYFDLAGVNTTLAGRYGDPTLLVQGASWRRAFGTVGNSNYYGFLCAVGSAFALWAVTRRDKSARESALAVAVLPFLCLAAFLSGSRTAVIALAAMTVTVFLIGLARTRGLGRFAVTLGGLCVALPLLSGIVQTLPVASRFFFIWRTTDSNAFVSIGARRAVWDAAVSQIGNHWAFGIGPGKTVLVQWVDNDFLRMTREFGLITSITYLTLASALLLGLLRKAVLSRDSSSDAARLGVALVLGVLLAGIAADVFYQDQVMGVLLLLGGCTVGAGVVSHE